MKKVIIIGAGPGGLASAMLLAKKGYNVHVYEKHSKPGGRSKALELGDYRFDLGPTFLMYIDILKEVFTKSGFDLSQELELIRLDPLYKLTFKDYIFELKANPNDNEALFEKYQPGLGLAYRRWLHDQHIKLKAIKPILEKPFSSNKDYFRKDVLKALPVLHPLKSVYQELRGYSKSAYFIHALSFQAKYLGMASYQAPSIFTFLPYLEHELGLYHVRGGIHQIHEKMMRLAQSLGATFHMNKSVRKVLVSKGQAYGVILENGEKVEADDIIINADFGYAVHHLFDESDLKKWTPKRLDQKKFSVSTLMIYLGLNQTYDFSHHEIIFSKDYNQYLKDLMQNHVSNDFSYYLHHPSKLDSSLAPKGCSSLYILIPVPNLKADVDWEIQAKVMRNQVIKDIEDRYQVQLTPYIQVEKIITPTDWKQDEHVHLGAVFNLSHRLSQMLNHRPHNAFEDIKKVYLVGGGTHPGSGLPTIYQSALIVSSLV